jgi:hypothetical protein
MQAALPPTPGDHSACPRGKSGAEVALTKDRLIGGLRHPEIDDPEGACAVFEGLELFEHNDSAGRYISFPIFDPTEVKALWDFLRDEDRCALPLGAA